MSNEQAILSSAILPPSPICKIEEMNIDDDKVGRIDDDEGCLKTSKTAIYFSCQHHQLSTNIVHRKQP